MSGKDEIAYSDRGKVYSSIRRFNTLRKASKFLDMEIIAKNDRRIKAHKVVMAACFPSLEDYFESNQGNILEWNRFPLEIIEIVIEFAYTGELRLNLENMVQVYLIGLNLRCQQIEDWCMDYIKTRISEENLMDVWRAAIVTENTQLINWCTPLIVENFNAFKNNASLLDFINGDQLKALLKGGFSKGISEEDKLMMIASWIHARGKGEQLQREGFFNILINELDLNKFSSDFIIDILREEIKIDLEKSLVDSFVEAWKKKVSTQSGVNALIVMEELYVHGVDSQSSQAILAQLSDQKYESIKKYNLLNAPACCVIGLKNSIYFIGGNYFDDSVHAVVKKVNPKSGQLVKLSSMNFERREHCAATNAEHIFVFGGITGRNSTSTASCEKYDPIDNSWSMLPAMSSRRYACGAVYVENTGFLVIGGFSELEPTYRMVELLEKNGRQWTWRTLSPTLGKYNKPAVSTLKNQVFVAGGAKGDLEMLSFKSDASNQWTHISTLNAEHGVPLSMLSYKDKLLLTSANGDLLELQVNTDLKPSNVLVFSWNYLCKIKDLEQTKLLKTCTYG